MADKKMVTYKGITKEIEFYKGKYWFSSLTKEMEQMELETNKRAVYNKKITGSFEYWKYWERRGGGKSNNKVSVIKKDFNKLLGNSEIDNKIRNYLNSKKWDEEYKYDVLNMMKKKSISDLESTIQYKNKRFDKGKKVYKKWKDRNPNAKIVPGEVVLSTLVGSGFTSIEYDVLNLREYRNKLLNQKKVERLDKFIEKYPEDNYGIDYCHLTDFINEIENDLVNEDVLNKQSKMYKPKDGSLWTVRREMELNMSELESCYNINLSYINYQEDIKYNVESGMYPELKGKKIPRHPMYSFGKKQMIVDTNEFLDKLRKDGLHINSKALKIIKDYIKINI